MNSMSIMMTVLLLGLTVGAIWLMMNTFGLRRFKTLSTEEIITLIDERIAYHTRGDAMEESIFGGKESIWNAPHYSKLKNEVSDHLREAELDSAIILIEKQRLKQLEIEELTLRLTLAQRGDHHDQP